MHFGFSQIVRMHMSKYVRSTVRAITASQF